MPDVRDLLAGAARSPGAELDVAAVERRGRVLRRRRRAGIGTAALAGLALPIALLVGGGGTGGEDRIVPLPQVSSTPPTVMPEPSRGGAAPTTPPVQGQPGAVISSPPLVSGSPAPTSLPPTGGAATPTSTTAPSSSPQVGGTSRYPAMRSCTVSTYTLTPGQSDTCRFTATAAGGWKETYDGAGVLVGDYETDVRIVVRRDGRTHTYTGECGSGLIRPGDRITISITQYDSGYSQHRLHAGAGFACSG